jgi:hypothetical protein
MSTPRVMEPTLVATSSSAYRVLRVCLTTLGLNGPGAFVALTDRFRFSAHLIGLAAASRKTVGADYLTRMQVNGV